MTSCFCHHSEYLLWGKFRIQLILLFSTFLISRNSFLNQEGKVPGSLCHDREVTTSTLIFSGTEPALEPYHGKRGPIRQRKLHLRGREWLRLHQSHVPPGCRWWVCFSQSGSCPSACCSRTRLKSQVRCLSTEAILLKREPCIWAYKYLLIKVLF